MTDFSDKILESVEGQSERFTNWYGFDTENDKDGKVTLTCLIHEGGAKWIQKYAGWLVKWCEKQTDRPVVICHNLEYDLVNEFGKRYPYMQLSYLKGRLITAKYHNVTFWDSFNHFRMTLADIGEALGIAKMKMDIYSEAYVAQDAWICLKAMCGARDYIRTLGGRMGATSGSSAMSVWKYMTEEEFLTGPLDTPWLRSGYYGGRTEIFRLHSEGAIRAYDVNSMYPYCMLKDFPEYEMDDPGLDKAKGMAEVTISIPQTLHVAPLVHREAKTHRLLYPVGVIRGVWSYDEIRFAQRLGAKVLSVHKGLGCNALLRPFDSYINTLYQKRKVAKDSSEKLFLKVLMNALYGKIATKGTVTKTVSRATLLENNSCRIDDVTWIDYHRGLLDYQTPAQKYVNMVWGSMITAYSRLELTKWLLTVPSETLIYCDTDSIFTLNQEMPTGSELGQLKQVEFEDASGRKFMVAKQAYVPQPKVYSVDEIFVAKGVPKPRFDENGKLIINSARSFIEDGFAAFQAPIRFRASLTSKRGAANQWVTMVKSRKTEYKSKTLSLGRYYPPVLSQQLELFPAKKTMKTADIVKAKPYGK